MVASHNSEKSPAVALAAAVWSPGSFGFAYVDAVLTIGRGKTSARPRSIAICRHSLTSFSWFVRPPTRMHVSVRLAIIGQGTTAGRCTLPPV
eukprot:34575-Prymnesium_polylepis.2